MNTKRTICLLSCLHSIKDSHTRHFIRVLSRNGYGLLSIRPGSVDEELLAQGVQHCELPQVGYHFWPEGTPVSEILRAFGQRSANAWRALKALVRFRPDVIMCMEPDSLLLAVLLKPWLGHRVVADLRELYEDRLLAFPWVLQPVLRPVFRAVMWLISLGTDEIMHVSEERRSEYRWLSKPGVVVVYYPDPLVYAADTADRPVLPVGFIALHAGPLRNSYAANQLLEAVRIARRTVPDLYLVVLGGKLQPLHNEILLAELLAEGAVILKGNVTSIEVGKYMAAAHIGVNLVLPVDRTHILAQPRKLYEYLLAGLPVLGANVPTIKRVLAESRCGLAVDPESPPAIAAGLVTLAREKEKRTEFGQNARVAANTRYNWKAQETVFLGLFKQLENADHRNVGCYP
jgi:glycosyltransferase involved in cell wall biosynthesis